MTTPNDAHPQPRERDAFERWATSSDGVYLLSTHRDNVGVYTQRCTDAAWLAWQAARSQPHEVIVAKEKSAPDGAIDEGMVEKIAKAISENFRTFGNEPTSGQWSNPLAHAMKRGPLVFALGVGVAAVVRFVIASLRGQEAGRDPRRPSVGAAQPLTHGHNDKP